MSHAAKKKYIMKHQVLTNIVAKKTRHSDDEVLVSSAERLHEVHQV